MDSKEISQPNTKEQALEVIKDCVLQLKEAAFTGDQNAAGKFQDMLVTLVQL